MSSVFDICAIDAGQTRVRYLIFHDGKTVLSGQTDQGITNILLPEALNTLKHHIKSMLNQLRETFGQYRFRVVSIGCTGIAKERKEYSVLFAHRSNAGLGGYRGDSGEAGAVDAKYPDLIEPVFFDSSVAIRRDEYSLVVSSLPGSKSMISIKAMQATVADGVV